MNALPQATLMTLVLVCFGGSQTMTLIRGSTGITEVWPLFTTKNTFVGALTADNGDLLQTLCEKCSDYFELIQGYPAGPAESQSLFTALPEGKDYGDKFLLGIFSTDTRKLIGVIDLIRDFPTGGEWVLGLMLIDPEFRASGLGSQVCQSLASWCQSRGAMSIRLGVVEDNSAGLRFWQKSGFEEFDRKPFQRHGSKEHTTIIMRRRLSTTAVL